MRVINLDTWPRRQQFEAFRHFDYPHFNLCANVDVTRLRTWIKAQDSSFTVALVYLLARVANEIPEFRTRIRGSRVVAHEVVHPSPTVLLANNLFTFCTISYTINFADFVGRAAAQMAYTQENPTLEDEPGQDDLLYMTSVPWVSFTGVMHPIHMHPVDSIPRIAWGKYFESGSSVQMPLSVQAHHALMDGYHAGQYYQQVQAYLDEPEALEKS